MCYSMRCDCTYSLSMDIGLANRVLHRSASPDSSLKCPWQPPNPLVSSLFLHLFLSGPASDGCCHISLPLSPGMLPQPLGPVMHDTICTYPIKCHFVNGPVSPHALQKDTQKIEAGTWPAPKKSRCMSLGPRVSLLAILTVNVSIVNNC